MGLPGSWEFRLAPKACQNPLTKARGHAASKANRQGEHLKRKVADCGSRHATAGEEQAMPAARQPPQTASNELMPPPLLAPRSHGKVADGAAVRPQRALQETLPTPASTPAAPSAIDVLTPAPLPLRRPACGSEVKNELYVRGGPGSLGRA